MKTELELDNGEVVELEFSYEIDHADASVGYAGGFDIYPEQYVPTDEDGVVLPSVNAESMVLTDKQIGKICSAIEAEQEYRWSVYESAREDYHEAQRELRDGD